MRHRNPVAAALAAVLLLAAGCGRGAVPPGRGSTVTTPTPSPSPAALTSADRQRAQEILNRWGAATGNGPQLLLVGSGTTVGDGWPPAENPDLAKIALLGGNVVAESPLSDTAPPPGQVQWDDGATETVPLISAARALDELRSEPDGPCGTCAPLTIDGATLSSTSFVTSRGRATVPAWVFHVANSNATVLRIAVGAERRSVSVLPEMPYDPRLRTVESATGSPDGTVLDVSVAGAPGAGDQPCGEDYAAVGVESDRAVVVFVFVSRSTPPPPGAACAAVAVMRSVRVTLASPLGQRTVLDARLGAPVPVTGG